MEFKLNDNWLIISGNDDENISYHESGILKENAVSAKLPCFTHMYIEDHLGISWYEKSFVLEKMPETDEVALLCFEMAVFYTEVSVNGKIVGTHKGVEDPFCFDVTNDLQNGENRITVRISKPYEKDLDGYKFDEIPHRNQCVKDITPGACYNESGICGEVSLKILPKAYIDDIYLVPNSKDGEICIKITVLNKFIEEKNAKISVKAGRSPEGEIVCSNSKSVTLKSDENTFEFLLSVPDFELWSVDNPVLYNVICEIECENKKHLLTKRTGFRTFEVKDDGYFYLNDKRIFLKCSHTGNCMPLSTHHITDDKELLRKDFLMAKSMGFNMLRFISGAALPVQLDLCDEIGLMIYEEPTAGWRTRNGAHAKECFEYDTLSMIKRDRSHPCVTIWGLLNETPMEGGFIDVCSAAINILPKIRKLDMTRLVMFSSGRWDRDLKNGSLCNPYKTKWECLLNGDGLSNDLDTRYHQKTGFGNRNTFEVGDVHYYPQPLPHSESSKEFLRTIGCIHKRPVFISETGIGSALDTLSLVNRFEQDKTTGFYPDVKKVYEMNETFLSELKKYGFDKLYPLPSTLMQGSMENHAKYRRFDFNLMRSNPYLNGLSLTGLLDHSICGEGVWTLFRTFKPKMAEVLQDGFSKLMWCIIPEKTSVFKGDSFNVEVLLSNEDVLEAGRTYKVKAAIINDGKVYEAREYSFTHKEQKSFVVPVFKDKFDTDNLSDGKYILKLELIGADVFGSEKEFFVFSHTKSRTGKNVYCIGLTSEEKEKIKALGFNICENYKNGAVILGDVKEENFDEINSLLLNGASVVALKSADKDNYSLNLLPEEKRPALNREQDWLYHREYVVNYESPFFKDMSAGVMDVDIYGDIFTQNALDTESAPDITHSMAFSTGYPNQRGYTGGFKIGTYFIGNGKLTLNTYKLLNSYSPMGEKLLVNIIDNA